MIACALLPAAHRARDPPYRQLPSCIGTLGLDGQAQALDLGHLGLALGLERGLFGIEAADKGFHLGALGLRCTGHTRPSRPPPPPQVPNMAGLSRRCFRAQRTTRYH